MKKIVFYKRKIIQILSTFLYNIKIGNFFSGRIEKGNIKNICVPGLNCYSCPAAVSSCPLGSFQTAIVNRQNKGFPFYIIGLLLFFGVFLGRLICGFLCPFGLIQEILYKIKTKKIKKNKYTEKLKYLKYVILIFFVILIPLFFSMPGFCKFLCPEGTLQAGIPLVIKNENLRSLVGFLFVEKVFFLIVFLVGSVFVFRIFCRFICPLGAIYSLFNKISFFGIILDEEKCINCNKCFSICKVDIKKIGDSECIGCTECIKGCPKEAIKIKKRY